jgi:8-oxo-dGTP pyrophosphatase MutT (NUDIX family)
MLAAVYVSNARKILGADVTQIDPGAVSPATGCTLELCAGIVDKNASVEEIARDEIKEECGYDIPAQHLQVITVCRLIIFIHLVGNTIA